MGNKPVLKAGVNFSDQAFHSAADGPGRRLQNNAATVHAVWNSLYEMTMVHSHLESLQDE